MQVTEISRYYSEKRSYNFHSIEIGASAKATLEAGEAEEQASARLLDMLTNRVQSDMDEAMAELVEWLRGEKQASGGKA